jgi:hypothetical protein
VADLKHNTKKIKDENNIAEIVVSTNHEQIVASSSLISNTKTESKKINNDGEINLKNEDIDESISLILNDKTKEIQRSKINEVISSLNLLQTVLGI